ncbi:MAG TPA: hypothetical protein VJ476_13260 [Rhizomicrobium sp.]|nr:hypothetical protein [Rhizomicrobium sp.]
MTSIANNFMARRATTSDRWYQEKREAYLGLLTALHEAAVNPSDKNAKTYALWQTRCSLFGSPTVSKYAQQMVDTNEGPRDERSDVFNRLVEAMRMDLQR